MTRIKTLARKLLSSDIRTLIRADFLNSDLTITERGRAGLDAIALEANLAELVKIAEERLAEDREDCSK